MDQNFLIKKSGTTKNSDDGNNIKRKKISELKMLKLKLKQRLKAKTHEMKRYTQRIEQYKVNKLFDQDQKKCTRN